MIVSALTGVPCDDIMSSCRCEEVSTARQLVAWALVTLCGYSHTQTGILMRRNASTITYAVGHVRGGFYGKKVENIKHQILVEYEKERQE